MKILCKGDQHLRDSKPAKRKDDYFEAQAKKHKFIFQYALENNISAILQPGDFFDKPTASISSVLNYFQWKTKFKFPYNVPEIAVFGQHDLFFHNKNARATTPLDFMMAFSIINRTPYTIEGLHNEPSVTIYGASWGEEIPEIETPDHINILLTHRMIIDDEKLWEGQEDFERASILLRTHKFDLIVAGDNHQCFTHKYRSRFLVNAGSIMRTSISQQEHQPSFFVYDSEEKTLERVIIPHESDVFDLEAKEREENVSEEVKVFIDEIQTKSYHDFSFRRNLIAAMKGVDADVFDAVKVIIKRSEIYEQFEQETRRLEEEDRKRQEGQGQSNLGARTPRKAVKRRVLNRER